VVTSLGGEQAAIELGERRIRHGPGQQPEALAAARLDQRRAQQEVEQSLRLPRARSGREEARVPASAHTMAPNIAPASM
jgi:hypothetical protein